MKAGPNCIGIIKHFEGLRLSAYLCPAQVATIGYGHTGPDVKLGMMITEQQAGDLLFQDLRQFEEGVAKLARVPLAQGEFDALVSFAFNLGLGNLRASTLLKKVNRGDYAGAALEFARWNKAGGKPLLGLAKRREAERVLFIKGTLQAAIAAANNITKA